MKTCCYWILVFMVFSVCGAGSLFAADDSSENICSIFSLANCGDQSSCETAGGHWCSNACQIDDCDGPACGFWHYDLCMSESECETAGGYWYNEECNGLPESGVSCVEYAAPSVHNVNMCDSECQASSPLLFGDDDFSFCFSYSDDVDVIMGFMSSDFTQLAWLDADCNVTDDFGMLLDRGRTVQCTVPIPEFASHDSAGWVFWLVSGTAVAALDWEHDAYDLLFEVTPDACAHYSGYHCIDCSLSCDTVFVNDLVGMIDCVQWQTDNCN